MSACVCVCLSCVMQNNFTKTSANLDLSLQRIDQLEKDSKQASEKYMYVQEVSNLDATDTHPL